MMPFSDSDGCLGSWAQSSLITVAVTEPSLSAKNDMASSAGLNVLPTHIALFAAYSLVIGACLWVVQDYARMLRARKYLPPGTFISTAQKSYPGAYQLYRPVPSANRWQSLAISKSAAMDRLQSMERSQVQVTHDYNVAWSHALHLAERCLVCFRSPRQTSLHLQRSTEHDVGQSHRQL